MRSYRITEEDLYRICGLINECTFWSVKQGSEESSTISYCGSNITDTGIESLTALIISNKAFLQ